MKNKLFYSAVLIPVFLSVLSGCIIFNKVSYEIELNPDNSGVVTLTATDLRSDASTDKEFEEDKGNLFNYMWKSRDFMSSMKKEGKNITNRELYLKNDTLTGKVIYKFDDIKSVEGIAYDDGFYYLTLGINDSVISTNGEVIRSKNYKRILWHEKIKTLKFEMFSFSFDKNPYRKLAPYYDAYK